MEGDLYGEDDAMKGLEVALPGAQLPLNPLVAMTIHVILTPGVVVKHRDRRDSVSVTLDRPTRAMHTSSRIITS
jgi:hypothetical protein